MSESMVERMAAAKVLIEAGIRYMEREEGVFPIAEFAFHGLESTPLDSRSLRELAYHASVAGDEEGARYFRKHARRARRERRAMITAALGKGD